MLQQLIGIFRFRFLCLLKSKTNNSSLELSINGLTQIADGKPVSTPNPEFKNKPTQGGFGFESIWLLLFAYFTKSPEYGQNLLPFDPIILTKADPFFF
ncbi:MAG: hypothetical protein EOP34_02045 [Rickettsiales bacterium]|nr:MAG: hypothetical protein EOP34_02045 [Rickettsiales bacterium]